MSKHEADADSVIARESQLTDAEIEAILLAEQDTQEDAPPALEMVQNPDKGSLAARWLLMFMLGLVLVGTWVRP